MGELYCIGYNDSGQLGLNDIETKTSLTQVGALTTWSKVYCLDESTMAIKADGTLWATGKNNHGQLGLGDTSPRTEFTQVGSGTNWDKLGVAGIHVLAIKTDGTLWSCGYNNNGQLGLNDTTDRDEFEQVGVETNWAEIAVSESDSLAIKTDGTLWACGRNNKGQLGLGDTSTRDEFEQVGVGTDWAKISCGTGYGSSPHSLAIKTDGTLWVCGENEFGQLGLNDTTDRDEFEQVGALTTWSKVAGGGWGRSHAIKTDGTLWACGYNNKGQLGLGDTSTRDEFEQVGSSSSWTDIAETGSFFCLALQTNALYGTGQNGTYQLLLGDTTQRESFTASSETSCATISCNAGNNTYRGFTFIIKTPSTPLVASRHKGNTSSGSVLFNGSQYVGDYANGKIYKLDMDTYTDDGLPITRTRRTQIINKERLNVIHNKVEIDFEHGVGLDVASDADGYDPQATLKWSDDEGNTWSSGISVSMGKYTEYETRAIWRRLGMSRNRIYELTIEEPVKTVITGAYADLKACRF